VPSSLKGNYVGVMPQAPVCLSHLRAENIDVSELTARGIPRCWIRLCVI